MKRILTLFLASVLLLGLVCSCGGDTGKGGNGGSGKDVLKTDDDYKLPEINMNGEDVVVLNVDQYANMKIDFTAPEDADDTLDIAIYESNKRLEEQFNFRFVEDEYPFIDWNYSHTDMAAHFVKNVNSGDDVYDFIHFPVNQSPDLITNGYVMELSELEGLHFDKPWWDTQLNKELTIDGRLYMAVGSINLMPYEGMTTIFFNKDMIDSYRLDNPYEMVRNGTWTIEALLELANEVISLGSDSHWHVYDGGTSTYGITRTNGFPVHFMVGAGQKFTIKEDEKTFKFNTGNDDFFLAAELMRPIFVDVDQGGIAIGVSDPAQSNFYIKLFGEGRSLFMMGELKAGVEMRDYDVNFGILPAPKLRAEQESYYSNATDRLPFICIPTLSENPEDVAKIIDAMAYDRYKNVIPVYYDSYVTYKGLRDEESVEMLEIMTEGRTMDVGHAYGWTQRTINSVINGCIPNGEDVASTLKSYEKAMNRQIEAFLEDYIQ